MKIRYDESASALLILDADPAMMRNPLFASFMRSKGGVTADDVLSIPTSSAELGQSYETLVKLLTRLGFAFAPDSSASTALESVHSDAARFQEFADQAAAIWARDLDTEAFLNFVAVVERVCKRTFYRKQLLSAFHLAFSRNACNFSVPGAGKTSIVYAAYAYLHSLPPEDPNYLDHLLIVGPLSSFKAWEDEYRLIFGEAPRSKRVAGALPARERLPYLQGYTQSSKYSELTLTTYQTIAYAEDGFRNFLSRRGRRTMMVLDEAHYIKNEDGFWAAAVLQLAKLASSRVVLTGTPAPNGYEDLVNLFRFLYPNRDIIKFPGASLRAMSDGGMRDAIPRLKAAIRPFFTRIRKSDLGLPPSSETRVDVPMSPVHEQIYRSLERRIVPQLRLVLDDPRAATRVKARIIRLRQASMNPALLLRPIEEEILFDTGTPGDFSVSELEVAELIRAFNSTTDLERLRICRQIADTALREQGKVLIWSYSIGTLQLIRSAFEGHVEFLEQLTGGTPVDGSDSDDGPMLGSREEIIDRFHSTTGPAVLIANPQAVGESISLHKACRTAIYFDRDFNAGRFIQSKDRIHRYNPAGGLPVSYFYLVSPGTVDEDIDFRLRMKEQRLIDLVDSEDIPLFTDDGDENDDIRSILDAYERRKAG